MMCVFAELLADLQAWEFYSCYSALRPLITMVTLITRNYIVASVVSVQNNYCYGVTKVNMIILVLIVVMKWSGSR